MTALAMRSAGAINAVSQLHGEVTREMFAPLWPERPAERSARRRRSRTACTCPTWVSARPGAAVRAAPQLRVARPVRGPAFWSRILEIPDEELWAARAVAARGAVPVHPRARAPALGGRARRRRARRRRRRDARSECADDRLRAAVHRLQAARPASSGTSIGWRGSSADAGRPVQFVFAGKAHPADEAGKHHLQNIFRHALDPRSSAAASPSSTTTTCTSRICSCRAATSGSTRRASRSRRAARAA